jgi:hypothetical protein
VIAQAFELEVHVKIYRKNGFFAEFTIIFILNLIHKLLFGPFLNETSVK